MPLPFARAFRADRRGNVAMLYALVLPVLMFGTGLAIDFTHAAQVRTELNAAADAAALAALTPAMMTQPVATAQAAAQNMFNGQIATIASLAPGDTAVTVSITTPTNNTLQRNVTVSYTAQNENIFAGILGEPTFALAGSSTASASQLANINFYLLLDNSPSMALPATQAGINQMIALTPYEDYENGAFHGCAFACHQTLTGSGDPSDTAGNPCAVTSGSTTTYPQPTVKGSYASSPTEPIYCAKGTQIDNYELARLNGIQLRLDALSTGITDLMSDAQTAQQNAAAIPPVYKFAAYTLDSSWQVGMSSTTTPAYNNLMAMTQNYVSGWATAAPGLAVMQYYSNNVQCGSQACTSSGTTADTATNYDNALGTINTIMPNPGNGTNTAGDTPQEVLFLITDGVEDETTSTCSTSLEGGNRCQAPINPSLCATIKNRGIRIAVLYTDYYPLTENSWYNTWVASFQPSIPTELQACASPGLFYDAGLDSTNLGGDLQALFNIVTQTAHLTQ